MLEIILLAAGITKAFQRPRLRRLTPQDFPGADPEKFAEWHKQQLRATDIFLWATWGAFIVKIGVLVWLSESRSYRGDGWTLTIIILILWLMGLGVAWGAATAAKDLRIAAGILWPPQPQSAARSAAPVQHAPAAPPVPLKTKKMRLLLILGGIIFLILIGLLLR